jgi:hypothetical protein
MFRISGMIVSAVILAPSMFAAVPAAGSKTCIALTQIDSTNALDDQTIIFKMKGGKQYKNTLPYKCSGLKFENAFSYRTSLSQLCNVDIITVLRSGSRLDSGPSCGLGTFEPYTPPAKAAK